MATRSNNQINNDIARAIYLSLKDKTGDGLSVAFKSVVEFLARKRLLSKAKDILAHLSNIINKENGVLEAHVTSAHKLEEKAKQELANYLKKRYSAREVILAETHDKRLLGGVRVEANYEVIDNTVKNKILALQTHLI